MATEAPVASGETTPATAGMATFSFDAVVTRPSRVADGSRFGGTTGLLGGIGGGTPRPNGKAAGFFFMVDRCGLTADGADANCGICLLSVGLTTAVAVLAATTAAPGDDAADVTDAFDSLRGVT